MLEPIPGLRPSGVGEVSIDGVSVGFTTGAPSFLPDVFLDRYSSPDPVAAFRKGPPTEEDASVFRKLFEERYETTIHSTLTEQGVEFFRQQLADLAGVPTTARLEFTFAPKPLVGWRAHRRARRLARRIKQWDLKSRRRGGSGVRRLDPCRLVLEEVSICPHPSNPDSYILSASSRIEEGG